MTTQEEKQLIQNLTEDILKTYQINILHDGIEDIVKKLNGVIIKNKSIQNETGVVKQTKGFAIRISPNSHQTNCIYISRYNIRCI